jgi:hypothetical protein
MHKPYLALALAALVSMSACGDDAPGSNPTAPTPTDDVTLKVSAPALVAPVNGIRVSDRRPALNFGAATANFVGAGNFTYRVQVMDAANAVIHEQTVTALNARCGSDLDTDKDYSWRVRAELEGAVGPWSAAGKFKSPERPVGYISGNEVYDPLTDGVSVATRIVGPHTWIPGEGIRLESKDSYIEYRLPEPNTNGEFSMVVSTVCGDCGDSKSNIMSMRDATSQHFFTMNRRRMTVEKRSSGLIAWRMLTSSEEVTTIGAERIDGGIRSSQTNLWRGSWRDGHFGVTVQRLPEMSTVYQFGKHYSGVYDPREHLAYVGSPYSGEGHGTVAGMTVRHVWLSSRPRPSWANQ